MDGDGAADVVVGDKNSHPPHSTTNDTYHELYVEFYRSTRMTVPWHGTRMRMHSDKTYDHRDAPPANNWFPWKQINVAA